MTTCTGAVVASTSAASGSSWVPGLLSLPASEDRRVQLSVRADWNHIAARLQDSAKVRRTVHSAIETIEGTHDDVLAGMVLRHLERVAPERDLRLHEMVHLLAILMGAERATKLSREVLGILEEGLEETWYEAKLRKKYGG